MKTILFAVTFLLLVFITPTSQACETGNPDSLAYIRREDNRCEGLLSERSVSTASSGLISIITGPLSTYTDILNIRIPTQTPIATDSFSIQASQPRKYLLDRLTFNTDANGTSFSLDTAVLKKADIPTRALHALAYTPDQRLHVPVILDRPDGSYTFSFFSPTRVAYPTIEVQRPDGSIAFTQPRNNPIRGIISIDWPYDNEPTGTYVLLLKDENGRSYLYRFAHNPQLL